MTGIIKTDQLQGAQSSTIAVPSGNNLTVGGTLGVTGASTLTGNTAITGDLNVDGNTLHVDAANNKVGLGVDPGTMPSFITHAVSVINGGGIGITSSSAGDNRYIFFGTGTSSSDVQLAAIQNTNSDLIFKGASGVERVRIDASGNLLVGTTNANPAEGNVAGIGLLAGNSISVTDDGGAPIQLNRKSSDGSIAIFRKDGSSVGNIGVSGGNNPYFSASASNHGGLIFSDGGASTPQMNPISSGSTLVDNAMNIGSASYRFKDLYLSGGLKVGGTGTANTLDDYEEGTFTPGLIDSGGGLGANLTTAVGQYTKVGNLVTFALRINGNARTSTGNQVYITGLPFTFSPATSTNRIQFELNGINLGLDSNFYGHIGQLNNTDTSLTILMTGTTLENFRGHDLTPSYEIYTHGSYFTS